MSVGTLVLLCCVALIIVVREYAGVPQLCRIPQQGGRIHESPRKFGHVWNQTSHEHFSSVRKLFRTERNELWLGAFQIS